MFNSLEEKIQEDEGVTTSSAQVLRYVLCAALAAVILSGLYLAIRLL